MSDKAEQSPEWQLVESAQNGCVASFGELYRRYYASVVALAYSATGDIHLSEDAAQETFAIACQDLAKLKSKDKFAAWLAGICRNVAGQMNRSKMKTRPANEQQSEKCESRTGDFNEEVRRVVWQLRQRDREPIVLRYYDNLPYEQIASMLGISTQAVHGRLIRAKRKIAKYLKRNGFTGADYGSVRER